MARLMTLLLVATLTGMAGLSVAAFGCKKPKPAAPTSSPATAPAEVAGNTNYDPNNGMLGNVRNAAKRLASLQDFNTLHFYIYQYELDNRKMPDEKTIRNTLATDAPNVLKAIDDGSIILCWTADPKGMWAYEVGGDTKGGIAIINGAPARHTAEEIKAHLPRR